MAFTLAAYLHTIDPYAIKLWEGGPIRWYGLSYLLGFYIGYLLIRRVCRVGLGSVRPTEAGDLIVTIAVGIVLGGRLGYALFYQPALFITFESAAPYWDLLAINKGGMASHGGMIGLIVASWWFAHRRKHRWGYVMDLGAFGAPLGLFFGRLANFVNGELYGRPTDVPWAVKFPQEMYHWDPDFLAGLRDIVPAPDSVRLAGADAYVNWLLAQIQGGNETVIRMVEPFITARHPSQLYQAALEGLVLFAVLAAVWMKPRKPLVVGGMFCATYGVVRIIGEFFREPDAHIGLEWLSLTRGQWLSIALMASGIIITALAARRKVESVGCWLAVKPRERQSAGGGRG